MKALFYTLFPVIVMIIPSLCFAGHVVEYRASYPAHIEQNPTILNTMPSMIVLSFNDRFGMMRMEVGGRFINQFEIWDFERNLGYDCMEMGGKKIAMAEKLEGNDAVEIWSPTGETKEILGHLCHGYLLWDGEDTSTAFITNDLGISFTMDYTGIEGFFLEFGMELPNFGTITFTAISIMEVELPDEIFSIADYEVMKLDKAKKAKAPEPEISAMIGRKCPKIKTTTMEGIGVSTKEFLGKVLVINFWFVNCPPCRKEIPFLNGLFDKYGSNPDVEFLAIALDGKGDIENFLETIPFKYPIIDNGRFLTDKFKIRSYPTNIVVDKKGIIQLYESGYSLDLLEKMEERIATALQQ